MPIQGTAINYWDRYAFIVKIDGVVRAAFNKCSGLKAEAEVIEYSEGGALTPLGRKQAARTAAALRKLQVNAIWSSTLLRAKETASIVAKVTRDRLMRRLDALYPAYGFAQHVGYIVPSHTRVVRERGPSPVHRLSFNALAYADL